MKYYSILIDDLEKPLTGFLVIHNRSSEKDLFEKCLEAWERDLFPPEAFVNGLVQEQFITMAARQKKEQTALGIAATALINLIDHQANPIELGELEPIVRKIINSSESLTIDERKALSKQDWKNTITAYFSYHERLGELKTEFESHKKLIIGVLDVTGDETVYTPVTTPRPTLDKKTA